MKKKVIVFFTIFSFILSSCNMGNSSSDIIEEIEEIFEYSSGLAILQTKENGQVFVKSEKLNVQYDISIVDTNGTPVEGYQVHYSELYDESTIVGYDPSQRFSSINIENNIDELLNSQNIDNFEVVIDENSISNLNSRFVSLLVIGIIFTVSAISVGIATGIIHKVSVQKMVYENWDGVYNGANVIAFTFDELIDWIYKFHIYQEDASDCTTVQGLLKTVVVGHIGDKFINPYFGIGLSTLSIIGDISKLVNINDPKGSEYEQVKDVIIDFLSTEFDCELTELEVLTYFIVDDMGGNYKVDLDSSNDSSLLYGGTLFITDPRLETLSGLYDIAVTVESSNNSYLYPIGLEYTGELFIKSTEDNILSINNFIVYETNTTNWDVGIGVFDKVSGYFEGTVRGNTTYSDTLIEATDVFSGTFNNDQECYGSVVGEDKRSPSGYLYNWEGSFSLLRNVTLQN